ncbi:hypothetical protein ACJIZ3_009478 [Penstemon smallii]|uniref:WRKY domain-containing protein n=1 Tax=Penstemon smallii TaxID=265156 RepID=A0ABD3TEL1_9LAMI
MNENNLHSSKRKRVIVELIKGKETATRLQTLLQDPVQDHDPALVNQLALQILRSFTKTLSELSSCAESTQIAALSGESKKKQVVKDGRGCYKRRKSVDSWVTVSSTMEDGCAWRKYGQKVILNSEYPRCYFRCTHKHEGCKALKQVQIMKEDPNIMYQITYFNRHTCQETLISTPQIDLDPYEPNLICFQSKVPIISQMKKEEDTQSEDAKSLVMDPWQDIMVGSEPIWDPRTMMRSYGEEEGSSLHGLDMEVNQFSNIDYFHIDEIFSSYN